MFLKIAISSELPLWISFFCILFGLALAALLYWNNRQTGEISKSMRLVLFGLRASYLSVLSFLLISPFVLSLDPVVEKPILIFGQDNTESVRHLSDSASLTKYRTERLKFLDRLSDGFDVHTYDFGEEVVEESGDPGFKDRLTDVSQFLTEMEDRYENRNVAMVMLASDGLYNKGQNPLYRPSVFPFVISGIALGDTNRRKDAWIDHIDHNRLAFLDNTFEINVHVGAALLQGRSSRVSVLRNGRQYASKTLTFKSDNDMQQLEFELPADQLGQLRFEVKIDDLDDEASVQNNSRFFYIDVLEGQQEILILSNAPHPDVAALKIALGKSKDFNVTASLLKDFNGTLERYNLLVLNQITDFKSTGLQNEIKKQELPVLHILGHSTSIESFNSLNTGLTLNRFKGKYNEASAFTNPNFQFFSLGKEDDRSVSNFPPLNSPFADYSTEGNMTSMFYQKIGKIETNYPLISFIEKEGRKTGFIVGEGIWRWPLYDFRLNASSEFFNDLIQKMVQYLCLKEDKSRFRVETEASYVETNSIRIKAEFYDKTYQLENTPDAEFQLIDESGTVFDYSFLKQMNTYRVDLGRLSPALYKWKASLSDGVEHFEKSGSFNVKALQLEQNSLQADHTFLYNLSVKNGGNLYYPEDLNELSESLLTDERFKPVLHYNERMKEIISFKWLFAALVLLFGLEWFLRKWLGLN